MGDATCVALLVLSLSPPQHQFPIRYFSQATTRTKLDPRKTEPLSESQPSTTEKNIPKEAQDDHHLKLGGLMRDGFPNAPVHRSLLPLVCAARGRHVGLRSRLLHAPSLKEKQAEQEKTWRWAEGQACLEGSMESCHDKGGCLFFRFYAIGKQALVDAIDHERVIFLKPRERVSLSYVYHPSR